jgi:hypothetical protein
MKWSPAIQKGTAVFRRSTSSPKDDEKRTHYVRHARAATMQTEARKLHPNLVPIRLRSFNRPKAFSSFPVKALAEAEWLSSVAAVRKDWPGSASLQPPTQLGAVIGLVAEALRCCGDEPFRGTVIRIDGCIGTTLLYHSLRPSRCRDRFDC